MKLLLRDLSSPQILEFWGLWSVGTAQMSSPHPAESGLGKDYRVRIEDQKRCLAGIAWVGSWVLMVGLKLRPVDTFVPFQSLRWVSFFISHMGVFGAIF